MLDKQFLDELEIKFDCSGVDWDEVLKILSRADIRVPQRNMPRLSFENSYVTVFVYLRGRLIGFGRAISDGVSQAAIYSMVVEPEFQMKGVGTIIMENIMSRVPGCNIILYAAIGKEDFYKRFGLRKMKTGMALFRNENQMSTMTD